MKHGWPPVVGAEKGCQGPECPAPASWLNQLEIYFSILQQKVLTPTDFPSLAAVAERLAQFERHYEQFAQPFQWLFTRRNLDDWLEKLGLRDRQSSALAA
jgi:hypothetical protein